MAQIKKSSFFRNRSFSAKKRFKMQSYLNEMSAGGLHINKIGKSSCVFDEDISSRFIYSVCGEDDEVLYSAQTDWSHFCNYKDVPFFKQEVPSDAVKLTHKYKKGQMKQETEWLNARLHEGLCLMGKLGDEYIFKRSEKYIEYEFVIKRKRKPKTTKDGKTIPPLGNTRGLLFICSNDDGTVYYFVKNIKSKIAVAKNNGKRLSDQIFSIFAATASAILTFASVVAIIYGLFRGGKELLPTVIIGGVCALIFGILCIVAFSKFKKITTARRIIKEEKRLKEEAENAKNAPATAQNDEKQSEQKNAEPAGNGTVVMNTVVMNNYGNGKKGKKKINGEGISTDGQLSDDDEDDQPDILDSAMNPASPEFARTVMNNIRYAQAAGDTLYQGEELDGGRHSAMNGGAPYIIYAEEPTIAPAIEDNEISENADAADENIFPLGMFVFSTLCCVAAIAAMGFGLWFGSHYFMRFGKENIFSLLFSALGVAFSPFLFRFGFTTSRLIMKEHSPDDEGDEDYGDDDIDIYAE